MRQMYIASPGKGHVTMAWNSEADVEAEKEVGKPAPDDAEVVDEPTARAVFARLMESGALFTVEADGTTTQVHAFPVEAEEITWVPAIAGG